MLRRLLPDRSLPAPAGLITRQARIAVRGQNGDFTVLDAYFMQQTQGRLVSVPVVNDRAHQRRGHLEFPQGTKGPASVRGEQNAAVLPIADEEPHMTLRAAGGR